MFKKLRLKMSLIILLLGLVQGLEVNGQTVHFDANGGTGTMDDMSGASITLPSCTFGAFNPSSDAATKHTFYKWNTKADGTGTDYAAGATAQFVEDVTLYAQWYIFFDIEAGSVEFLKSSGNENFTGYVFVNKTAQKITGRHYDNSRYYIFTSHVQLHRHRTTM